MKSSFDLRRELQGAIDAVYSDVCWFERPVVRLHQSIASPVEAVLYEDDVTGLTVAVEWSGRVAHMRLGTQVPKGVWLVEDEPGKLAAAVAKAQEVLDALKA